MGRVLTEALQFNVADETAGSPGTLPGSPSWLKLQVENATNWGPKIKTMARDFIGGTRQMVDGSVVDEDSAPGLPMDLTLEHAYKFFPGFMFASLIGPVRYCAANATAPTAVTSTGYTVPSTTALAAGTLIYVRGCAIAANNGLKVVGSSSTTTEIKASGLTAETLVAADNPTIEVAGVQGGTGDIRIDASGDITATTLNLSTLGLTVGQTISVGGATAATQFGIAANNTFGRIATIAAGKLTMDWSSATGAAWAVDLGTGKTIQLLFGAYLRNVERTHANFLERSVQIEAVMANLGDASTDEYWYSKGNYHDSLDVDFPTGGKVGMTAGFVGTTTPSPVLAASRAANASAALKPQQVQPFNTAAGIARLRIAATDETGDTTYFQTHTLSIKNEVTPVKVEGTLGALFMNYGKFMVNVSATMLLTSSDVIAAIRALTKMTMQWSVQNSDGGMFFDIPRLEVADGTPAFPRKENVTVNLDLQAKMDPTLGHTLAVSFFPYLPPVTSA